MRWTCLVAVGCTIFGCQTTNDVAATAAADGTPLVDELAHSTQPAVHGMVVFGSDHIYLYHLPLWSGVHAWQIILEAQLDDATLAAYRAERAAGATLNTFVPEHFPLANLAPGFEFAGTLFHGHFEQGGTPVGDGRATVRRIVMVTPLRSNLPALPTPTFRLFGVGQEWYLAHVASERPNFDQVVTIAAPPAPATPEQLAAGITVTIPNRTDTLDTRPRPGEQIELALPAASIDAPSAPASVTVTAEPYFSTVDLGN